MGSAAAIACQVQRGGTLTLLARVDNWAGALLTQATVSSIAYTIYELDDADPDSRVAVTQHTAVAVAKATSIFDALQEDDLWGARDSVGYNFRHTIDVSAANPFDAVGDKYLIRYTVTPTSGQAILGDFRAVVI